MIDVLHTYRLNPKNHVFLHNINVSSFRLLLLYVHVVLLMLLVDRHYNGRRKRNLSPSLAVSFGQIHRGKGTARYPAILQHSDLKL